MRRCPKCLDRNADDAVVCKSCGSDKLDAPERDDARIPSPFSAEASKVTEIPVAIAIPAADAKAEEHNPPPAEEPEAPRQESRQPDLTAPAPGAGHGTEFRQLVARYINDVSNPKVLVFFGHSNSGKSWFINRLKRECPQPPLQYAHVDPSPFDKHDKGQTKGYTLESTRGVDVHFLKANNEDSWLLVDVQGEAFSDALERRFRGATLQLLEAVALADSFIFTIPAGEALAPEDYFRARRTTVPPDPARDRTQQLINNVNYIAALVRHVGQTRKLKRGAMVTADKSIEQTIADDFVAMTDKQRADVLNAGARSKTPALLLLTKADSLELMTPPPEHLVRHVGRKDLWADLYDADPVGMLSCAEGPAVGLVKTLDNVFERLSVDFVSPFHGHVELPLSGDSSARNLTLDYKLPHYGVIESIQWLKREVERSRNPRTRKIRGEAQAVALRRAFDPNYRAAMAFDAKQRSKDRVAERERAKAARKTQTKSKAKS